MLELGILHHGGFSSCSYTRTAVVRPTTGEMPRGARSRWGMVQGWCTVTPRAQQSKSWSGDWIWGSKRRRPKAWILDSPVESTGASSVRHRTPCTVWRRLVTCPPRPCCAWHGAPQARPRFLTSGKASFAQGRTEQRSCTPSAVRWSFGPWGSGDDARTPCASPWRSATTSQPLVGRLLANRTRCPPHRDDATCLSTIDLPTPCPRGWMASSTCSTAASVAGEL